MIEFMVLALPRSGTTWASNWLTTDATLCLHDPLYRYHYAELDAIKSDKMIGVSCTGLYHFGEWVNKHPARKVILHRPLNEINDSMRAIGLPELSAEEEEKLNRIDGFHTRWTDLFTYPDPVYEYLLQKPFDAERHAELKMIEMQPQFAGLTINREVTRKLVSELRSI